MSTYLLAPAAPVPAQPAQQLVSELGGEVVDTALDLAPVVVPFLLALLAVGWVLSKFGLRRAASLPAAVGEYREVRYVRVGNGWVDESTLPDRSDPDARRKFKAAHRAARMSDERI